MQCVTLEIKNLHGCLSWYVRQPLEECDPKIGSFLSSTLKAIESWIWFILRSVLCGTLQTLPSLTLWSTWTGFSWLYFSMSDSDLSSLQDDQWRERIHEELLRKMAENQAFDRRGSQVWLVEAGCFYFKATLWKLFSERTPDYSGEVRLSQWFV